MVEDIKSQKRSLFLITSSFPYGEFETFLEIEFPYLADAFDSVIIIHTELGSGISRIENNRAQVHYLPYLPDKKDKWKYPGLVANTLFLKEFLNIIIKDFRIPTPGILSSMAGSLMVGYRLRNKIVKLINDNDLWKTDIHLYSYWCNDMATGLCLLKSSYPDLHCISRAHGYDVYLERSPYKYLPFRRLIYSTLDAVFFVSQHGRNYARSKFGGFKSFAVSYLGVHKGVEEVDRPNSRHLQLVSCSSVIEIKRIDKIIESLAVMENIEVRWTHIGGGRLLNYMKHLADKLLSIKPNVTFEFLGQLSNEKTILLYKEIGFDLFINISKSEGIPVAMMEALAHGIPVLGPDVGGINELIENWKNGILVPPDISCELLAEKIEYFGKLDDSKLKDMSHQARRIWARRFQAEVNFPVFIRQLQKKQS